MVRGKLIKNDPETAAKITRAILKGSKWVNTNPKAAAQLSVDKKYIGATADINAIALSNLDYAPSIQGASEAVLSAAAEMKKIGLLEASTDPIDLAKRRFTSLPSVTDEWLRGLVVEKVAGGGPMLDAEITAGSLSATPTNLAAVKDF